MSEADDPRNVSGWAGDGDEVALGLRGAWVDEGARLGAQRCPFSNASGVVTGGAESA